MNLEYNAAIHEEDDDDYEEYQETTETDGNIRKRIL